MCLYKILLDFYYSLKYQGETERSWQRQGPGAKFEKLVLVVLVLSKTRKKTQTTWTHK